MNTGAIGGGAPGLDPQVLKVLGEASLNPLKLLSALPGNSPADNVSLSLEELATPSMQHLLQVVVDILSRTEGPREALALEPKQNALDAFPTYAAPALAYDPNNTITDARNAAEKSVAKAMHVVETAKDDGHRIPDNLNPLVVLTLANQLIVTGQLPNYVCASELARLVSSWYEGPVPVRGALTSQGAMSNGVWRLRGGFWHALKNLWRRAPLLILLGGWAIGGGAFGIIARLLYVPTYETRLAFDIWGMGFLVLIGFQFIATIRGARFKP